MNSYKSKFKGYIWILTLHLPRLPLLYAQTPTAQQKTEKQKTVLPYQPQPCTSTVNSSVTLSVSISG